MNIEQVNPTDRQSRLKRAIRRSSLMSLVTMGLFLGGSHDIPNCVKHAYGDRGRILLPDEFYRLSGGQSLDIMGLPNGPRDPDAYFHSFQRGYVHGRYSPMYQLRDPSDVVKKYNVDAKVHPGDYPDGIIQFGDQVEMTGVSTTCNFPSGTFFVEVLSVKEVSE